MNKTNRRHFIGHGVTAAAAVTATAIPTAAAAEAEKPAKNDLKDYNGMNEVFQGRFGAEPPVRTTIAAAGGMPGNSLVEIDVIAYI